ncbi:MAG: invasion associated locus B family protein [Pseudomonadota bacterium]
MGRLFYICLAVCLAAGAPSPGLAQTADTGEAPSEDSTAQDNGASEAAAPDSEAAAPAPEVPEGPAEGSAYVAETFVDWSLTCIRTNDGNDPCRFIQVLENGEGGRVAQVSVVPLPPDQPVAAAAIIETPLGTLLRVPTNEADLNQPGGLRIQVDDGELRVFQFTFCNSGGCVAEIGMEQDLVDAFKRGSLAKITIWSVDAPGQPVELNLSLRGFTAGFDRVATLSQGGQ